MIKNFDQMTLNLSQGHPLYDKIVPKNHLLRLIHDEIDFSFVTPLQGLLKSNTLIIDATHTKSKYQVLPIEKLRDAFKNIRKMEKEEITAVTPLNPIVLNGGKREVEGFEYNKDAGQMRCLAGHLNVRKARTGKKNQKANQSLTYYFDIEKCKNCPLREGCYRPGAKTKTYSITIKSEIHQKAIDYQKTEEFKERKKQRYQIEAKNAELKQSHEFTRVFNSLCRRCETNSEANKLYSGAKSLLKYHYFTHKKKGAYYFKNNKLLFQCPRL